MARFTINLGNGVMLVLKNGKLVLVPPCDPEIQAALDAAAVLISESREQKGAARKRLEAAAMNLVAPHSAAIDAHVAKSTG